MGTSSIDPYFLGLGSWTFIFTEDKQVGIERTRTIQMRKGSSDEVRLATELWSVRIAVLSRGFFGDSHCPPQCPLDNLQEILAIQFLPKWQNQLYCTRSPQILADFGWLSCSWNWVFHKNGIEACGWLYVTLKHSVQPCWGHIRNIHDFGIWQGGRVRSRAHFLNTRTQLSISHCY